MILDSKNLLITSPTNLQFSQKLNDNSYLFIQLKRNKKGNEIYHRYKNKPKELLKEFDNKTINNNIWFIKKINYNNISENERNNIINSYGCNINDKFSICEGYFENLYDKQSINYYCD